MGRYYTDKGLISKGATLNIKEPNGTKYFMLLPVSEMPETKTAPDQVDKSVLSDNTYTYTEGMQNIDQKTYTFNYHRDNIRQLKKYKGMTLDILERNADNTGEKFKGSITFGRSSLSVNGIQQGQLFVTVASADEDPIDDVRDLIMPTAIITTPLPDVTVEEEGTFELSLETSPNATVTVENASAINTIATATIATNKLTITGVAAGTCIVNLKTSATNEADSYRSIAVEVLAK